MKKKANELIFISQIKRDGSGTLKVNEGLLNMMLTNKLCKDEYFDLYCLSMTKQTYIAINFNAFIVKLKP